MRDVPGLQVAVEQRRLALLGDLGGERLDLLPLLGEPLDVASELGNFRDIGDLSWEALESVLRAERFTIL